VSHLNLTSELISNPHQAQIIHQNGTLIFANTAAARIFGFDTIIEFVKFAKATALFANKEVPVTQSRTRILSFNCLKGEKKRAQISERRIDWHGSPSVYLTLKPLFSQSNIDGHNDELEETYVVNTIHAAMNWSSLDGDTIEVKSKPFDFAGICLKLCDELQDYANAKGVTLCMEIKPRAQKIFHGDCLKMARAGACMVRHAIDRTPNGQVSVTLRASENGDYIIFEVCDSGSRYTPSDANTLFDTKRRGTTTGFVAATEQSLDLPLAQCIARHLGGEVALKINHPAGGLVRMRLPFREVIQDALSMRTNGQTHRKLDILVVEDNYTSQHVLKVILDALGHRATMASNGKECLDILSQANFDVILMDLHMPVQDGYDAIRQIRARERSGTLLYDKEVPILAVTADRRPETRTRALACGVTGFLNKPIHIPQIMAALAPFIERVADPLVRQPSQNQSSQAA
jgi:two-component system, sensor histidine kinase